MQFVNPVATQADVATNATNATNLTGGGTASGSTAIAGQLLVGNPAAAHVIVGTDANGADGVRLYGADGVTPLIDLNIASPFVAGAVVVGAVPLATSAGAVPAAGVTAGTLGGTVVVPGGNVSGAVASATTATTATTATNLGGGGTAAGTTTITGAIVVGNPAAAHVVVGSDAHGADGVRLYASDGVTPLIDLTIAGTPTITGAIVQTATAGARIVMDGVADHLTAFGSSGNYWQIDSSGTHGAGVNASTGDPQELGIGQQYVGITGAGSARQAQLALVSPGLYSGSGAGPFQALIEMNSGSVDLSLPATISLEAGLNQDLVWDGTTLAADAFHLGESAGIGRLVWDGVTLTVPGSSAGGLKSKNASGVVTLSTATGSGTGVAIQPGTAGSIALVVQALTGQTGPLQRWLSDNAGVPTTTVQVLSAGQLLVNTLNAITPSSVGSYALQTSNAGGVSVALGSDANAAYLQSAGGKPLRLNHSGNAVTSLQGLTLGNTVALGGTIYSGSGAPATTLGVIGDTYTRIDTPGTALQRIYFKTAAAVWTGIV